jgi:hypothetical protein
VQILYKPAGGAPRVVQSFDASADSGKAPGAVAGGLHGVSETKHTSVSSDAKRLGDSVAKQVAEIGVREGWLSTGAVKHL